MRKKIGGPRDIFTNRGGSQDVGEGNNHSSEGDDPLASGDQFWELVKNEVLVFSQILLIYSKETNPAVLREGPFCSIVCII